MLECIKLIKKSNNILIFTGAGISTNCGIPDFRSSNGLYSYAEKKYKIPYPEAIFDINYFDKNPQPFFELSRDLLSNKITPTTTHKLIKKLEDMGRLKVVVTQNIDMLHERAGNKRVLSCHGTYQKGTCRKCNKKYEFNIYGENIHKGIITYCKCGGVIKPNITFFGENLPLEFYDFIQSPPTIDLVIVMGTSLEVQPANQIPLLYKNIAPLIIVNLDKTNYDSIFDYTYKIDCDDFSNTILNELIKI